MVSTHHKDFRHNIWTTHDESGVNEKQLKERNTEDSGQEAFHHVSQYAFLDS